MGWQRKKFILKYMESEVGLGLGVMLNRKMGITPWSSERSWGSNAHTDHSHTRPLAKPRGGSSHSEKEASAGPLQQQQKAHNTCSNDEAGLCDENRTLS